jgi:hypothetical protein
MKILVFRLFSVFAFLGLLGFSRPAHAATLTGSVRAITQGSSVNLSTNGTIDWVHWGLYTESSLNRKAGVLPEIGDFITVSGLDTNAFVFAFQFSDNYNGYTWTDGDPVAGVTNTTTGVWAYGIPAKGTGFEFTVPAGASVRTLKVYCGVFAGTGHFTASLSDDSAPDYTTQFSNIPSNGESREVTLHFAANSNGQTLKVRWVLLNPAGSAAANVTLQAAALSAEGANNPPIVHLTSPAEDVNIAAGTGDVTLTATASDLDGTVSTVDFYVDGSKVGTDNSSPYTTSWNNPAPGRYSLRAVATDNGGETTMSLPVDVLIYESGGSLSVSAAQPPRTVNLTTEGTVDWEHWGLSSSNLINRKSGVTPLIDMETIGTSDVHPYSDNYTAFGWSDGIPTLATAPMPNGIFVYGRTNGFELVVPADAETRHLRVYVGLYGAQGHFQAWLSDFSAPAYHNHSLSNFYASSYGMFTLDYAAASANRTLIVRYIAEKLFDHDFGNVTLQAATLQGGSASLMPVEIINPVLSNGSLRFSFLSVMGRMYEGQWRNALDTSSWQTFTTVAGTGNMLTITNQNTMGGQRFYRVETK